MKSKVKVSAHRTPWIYPFKDCGGRGDTIGLQGTAFTCFNGFYFGKANMRCIRCGKEYRWRR